MTPIPIDESSAHIFAAALRDYAGALSIETAQFSLARFQLTVASDSAGYLALCRRALVDDPRFAQAEQRPLHLSVLDYVSHPQMPQSEWVGEMYGAILTAKGLAAGGYEGTYELPSRLWQIYEIGTGRGVEALHEPGRFEPWVASFPLRNFLHWAYQSIGWRIVHAGTLAVDGKGVMIIGSGGAGKSGTTLSGVMAGLDSAGDDYVAMNLEAGKVSASPVMRLMKQDHKGLARLGIDPGARGLGVPNWQNKYEFDFEVLGAGRRAQTIELKAILMPRIAHAERSSLRRAPAQAAMMALAPSNLQQLPGGWREAMAFTGEIARRLPAYYLDLGNDPAEIAGTIRGLIAETGQ
ncbi:MAG: serine kinase [Devosia sp.]